MQQILTLFLTGSSLFLFGNVGGWTVDVLPPLVLKIDFKQIIPLI